MKHKKSNNQPFWIEHPEYYPDGPNTHLKKKPKFKLCENKSFSMQTLKNYTLGCGSILIIVMFLLGIFLILGKMAEGIGIKWLPIFPLVLLFGWLLMKGRQKIISDGVKDALKETEEEHRNR
ncbi:MAG: hypothetical protein ACI4UF_01965 [Thermoguttaceae bacterium]